MEQKPGLKILFLLILLAGLSACYSPPATIEPEPTPDVDPIKALFINAETSLTNQNFEAALGFLNEIINNEPENTKAHILRATTFEFMLENQKAQEDLKWVIKEEPRNFLAHYNLGNLLFKQSDYETAVYHYTLSIVFSESFYKAYLNRANAYMQLEEYQNALDDYKKYIEYSDYQRTKISMLIQLLEEALKITPPSESL